MLDFLYFLFSCFCYHLLYLISFTYMNEYTIYGGDKGKSRLDILSRAIGEQTEEFIRWGGLSTGYKCLDLGCGGGHVSMFMSGVVGSSGSIKALDLDKRNIEIADTTCRSKEIVNIQFQQADVYQFNDIDEYDLVYSRFLFSHLHNPQLVLNKVFKSLKTGGTVLIEDTDFSGHFSHPPNKAFDKYVSLYQKLLKSRGADANRGQNLTALMIQTGFTEIEFRIYQPAHISGEGKLMAEITFEGIMPSLLEERLVDQKKAYDIYHELIAFRKKEHSMMSMPRIFQIKAKRF